MSFTHSLKFVLDTINFRVLRKKASEKIALHTLKYHRDVQSFRFQTLFEWYVWRLWSKQYDDSIFFEKKLKT